MTSARIGGIVSQMPRALGLGERASEGGRREVYSSPVVIARRQTAPVLLLAAILLPGGACSGEVARVESGTECTDGKDNDGDKLIDCDDFDCKSLPVCGGRADARLDGQRDGPVLPPDRSEPDKPRPDQATPSSSFGQTCAYQYPLQTCPDGKTYCIRGYNGSQTVGYCAWVCTDGDPDSCPQGPAGTTAKCVYTFNGTPYCHFMCRWQSQEFPCPSSSFSCYGSSYQAFCTPN